MSGASGLRLHGHTSAGDGGTLGSPTTLDIPAASSPAQTVDGRAVWDSDDDKLTVGTGAGRKTLVNEGGSLSLLGAPTGDFSIGSHKLTNVTDPASAQDAATKAYVDANIAGAITYSDHGNTGSTETVDASLADIHRLVANAATVTLTLTGWPVSGTPSVIRLWLEQDGSGGRIWAFPVAVDWGDPGEPDWTTRTSGEVDLVDLMTVDGGTAVKATVGGRAGPAGVAGAFEDLTTTEMDTSLVAAPDGAGGLEFRAETAGAASGILARNKYAPSSLTIFSITGTSLADVDATNMIVTFTAPASGNVLVQLSAFGDETGADMESYWGLREGSTDLSGSVIRVLRNQSTQAVFTAWIDLTGLSAGSHTYKWSAAVSSNTHRIIVQDGSATTKFPPALMVVWAAP